MHILGVLLVVLALRQQPPQGPVKELHGNGKVKVQYTLDADGKKHGSYEEFYENGKRRLACFYAHGELDRAYEEFHENGKPKLKKRYAKGKIDGELIRLDDQGATIHRILHRKDGVFLYPDFRQPVKIHPRALDALRAKLDEIDPPSLRKNWPVAERCAEPPSVQAPHAPGKLKPEYVAEAHRHLLAYRYLSELPIDIGLHEPYNEHCQHGAIVLAATGALSHQPSRPGGMDKDFFEKGYLACSKSNISWDQGGTLRDTVDGFMHDSDPGNIDDVGHRAWILAPEMGKVGFGEAGAGKKLYKTIWVIDRRTPGKQPLKLPSSVAYPAAGYYPAEYLALDAAWSVVPQGDGFPMPPKSDLTVEVWKLTDEYDLDRKLDLNYVNVARKIWGTAAIFRPVFAKGESLNGGRFLVALKGKDPGRLAYVVEFFKRN